MWTEILKHLSEYPEPVFSWLDPDGFPYSVRSRPEPEAAEQRLRIELPAGLPVRAGPASLMSHKHDELIWNVDAFLVRGRLEPAENGWWFYPTKFIPSQVASDPVEQFKGVLKMRRTARQYLEKRDLKRPRVRWAELMALWAELEQE